MPKNWRGYKILDPGFAWFTRDRDDRLAGMTNPMLQIDQKLLDQIFGECLKRHPEEACGLLIGTVNPTRKVSQVIPCRNIQNELHNEDPKRYLRDAKIAYSIDPKEMEAVQNQAGQSGQAIIAIFHSHPEHGVYFSAEDKGMAAPWGEPLFPYLSYIVVSVYGAKVKAASEFYWEKGKKDFMEHKIL